MSNALTLLLFIALAVLVAVGSHAYVKRYFLASLVAAGAMAAGIQFAGYIELGHIDPFWPVTSLAGFLMAGIISLVVGLPFRIWRIVQRETHE
jgi:presenilin-like A22 family membrane protease